MWKPVRLLELALSTGIPLIGFAVAANGETRLTDAMLRLVPAVLLAGWHVLLVNDLAFAANAPGRQCFAWNWRRPVGRLLPTLVLLPILAGCFLLGRPTAVLVLLLVVINWDIYSLAGKRHWAGCVFHNFIGGGLHFTLGAAAAAAAPPQLREILPGALFFALAMAAASFHHDAVDVREDRLGGYLTGAVRFGARRWWRLGLFPMTAAQIPLLFAAPPFAAVFTAAYLAYLALYLRFVREPWDGRRRRFRFFCRGVYALAGAAYIAARAVTRAISFYAYL